MQLNRKEFLDLVARSAVAFGGTALPWARLRAESPGPVMTALSTYMAAAGQRALPSDVVEKTKHHILDTFAAMISGSELPPGRAAIAFARASGGDATGTVVGSMALCGPMEAAFVNGMLAHSDETDDSHSGSQSHPGSAVVPAALAVAEKFGGDGAGFVRAVALGYDVGPRVTMALGGVTFRTESHRSTHSIAGTFGASAAAGCVARLNAQQMRWLLDYAAQQASGFAAWERDTDHIEKAFVFAGMPARNGVTAALVVRAGWNGVDDVFSGEDNFFEAMAPKGNPATLVDRLGERYEVTQTDIKKWTVGSPIQAPLDALANLLRRHPFDADQVQHLVVRLATSAGAVVNNREIPDISLQHMVAVMLVDKTASFKAAHDKARMQDVAILKHRAKVELVLDEELERKMPQRQAIVEVTLVDGTRLVEHVETVRGTAANPMDRAEVADKCRDLIAPVLGKATADRLVETVLTLETTRDIRLLRPLLQRP
jgi:2-methylcitrate dehydratase PrpD